MYRTATRPPDPLLVVPGDGLREILVGHATPEQVLETFGRDAQLDRRPDGEIYRINYDYAAEGVYEPNRPGNESRPAAFEFDFGLLHSIGVGAYQSALYTRGGVRIRSERSAVIAAFGPPDHTRAHDGTETLRYVGFGIEFRVSAEDDFGVASLLVFRGRRL